ncbi:hypothetical protein HN51_054222, partial [Arachis hypogaea]
ISSLYYGHEYGSSLAPDQQFGLEHFPLTSASQPSGLPRKEGNLPLPEKASTNKGSTGGDDSTAAPEWRTRKLVWKGKKLL